MGACPRAMSSCSSGRAACRPQRRWASTAAAQGAVAPGNSGNSSAGCTGSGLHRRSACMASWKRSSAGHTGVLNPAGASTQGIACCFQCGARMSSLPTASCSAEQSIKGCSCSSRKVRKYIYVRNTVRPRYCCQQQAAMQRRAAGKTTMQQQKTGLRMGGERRSIAEISRLGHAKQSGWKVHHAECYTPARDYAKQNG